MATLKRVTPLDRAGTNAENGFPLVKQTTPRETEASVAALTENPVVKALLDATGVSVMVLNRQRQIVVGNAALLAALGNDPAALRDLAPGQAMQCVHASKPVNPCGTSKECGPCGILLAVLGSQRTGTPVERECLLSVERGGQPEAHELRVKATTLDIGGETFTVLGLRDISAEKRREALERVFFHDVSNTLGALLLQADALNRSAPSSVSDATQSIKSLADRLRREIENQRVLLQAERGTLALNRRQVRANAVISVAAAILKGHPAATNRTIEVTTCDTEALVLTDEGLLVRVLVNMIKNALEATPKGGAVRLYVEPREGQVEFRVWNTGVIAPDVALRIFKRSFSTKPGGGRGLGTFSMKLFGERFLGGTVGFTSSEEGGTNFFLRLPA